MGSNPHTGPIAWMAKHRVAANIAMIVMLFGGFIFAYNIKKEVFPEFEIDMVNISVAYPGATPAEIEKSIILPIEEELSDVEGIKELRASAREGAGSLSIEIEEGAERMRVYQEVERAVDGVAYPDDARTPIVSLSKVRKRVLTIQLFGGVDEYTLRAKGEELRQALLDHERINQIDMQGEREYRVFATIDKEALHRHSLSYQDIANSISAYSLELSAGSIKSRGGEVLVRVDERREYAPEFRKIPILKSSEGGVLFLEDIAKISEGFAQSDSYMSYNGMRALSFEVYRTGSQTPLELSEAVREVLGEYSSNLPDGVQTEITNDMSEVYQARLDLLLKNGLVGLLLVVLILGMFLEFRVAFWVAAGIPIAFMGSFIFLPFFDLSINMVSMFAFIIALGIVVDDAIIAGENIYEYRQLGYSNLEAAIEGAKDIKVPLTFAIITNIVAFSPLLFVPGFMGKLFMVIPAVVATVFVLSWFEALFILPNHLAYADKEHTGKISKILYELQQKIANLLAIFVERVYSPALRFFVTYRYATLSFGLAVLMLSVAYAQSGRMGFDMMPRVESDRAVAQARLPLGATHEEAMALLERLVDAGVAAKEQVGAEAVEGYRGEVSENIIRVDFYLVEGSKREIGTADFNAIWRENLGRLPDVEYLKFRSDIGGPGGGRAAISLQLAHYDIQKLEQAGAAVAAGLERIEGVKEIEEDSNRGKKEFVLTLTKRAKTLDITALDIAREIRNAYSGAEALSQQRGREEMRVKVLMPFEAQERLYEFCKLPIKTKGGSVMELGALVDIEESRSYATISRENGKRIISVSADVDDPKQLARVKNSIDSNLIPDIKQRFDGVEVSYGGRQADTRESMKSLLQSFLLVMVVIYIALAIPFQSYTQPIMVMVAIPFGVVGAILGHLIMDYSLSVISMMGIVALSGVVINDTLVMVDYANRKKRSGQSPMEAILSAGARRFRPIFLTTATTFCGLAPMIFETSIQARFLIPMAISLGYGIVFATFITLIIIPSLYMVLQDIYALFGMERKN